MRAKTFLTLLLGVCCGIVLSPISLWIYVLNNSPYYHHDQLNERQSITSLSLLENELQLTDDKITNSNLEIVGVSVLSGSKALHTRAAAVYHSYGKILNDHFKIYTFPTGNFSSGRANKPSYLKYMKHYENDVDPRTSFVHLLQNICDNSLYDKYHYLLILQDDIYVQVKNLRNFINSLLLSTLIPLYIGMPSGNGHCTIKNGVLLHYKAFQKICPNLNHCMQNGKYSWESLLPGEDSTDKCIRTILGRDCWTPQQEDLLFYHNKEIGELSKHDGLHRAITIHPVTTSEQFVSIHRLVSETQANQLLNEAESLVTNMIAMETDFVQSKKTTYKNKKWLWYNNSPSVNPKSKHELVIWKYSDSTNVYQLHEHMPSLHLLNRHKAGINMALLIAIKWLNSSDNGFDGDYIRQSFVNECYFAVDESQGMEYILNISIGRKSTNVPLTFAANVFLPLKGPGFVLTRPANDFIHNRINLIVPIADHHNLMPFLEMYENECIKLDEPVCLHLVFFVHDEVAIRQISQIKNIYTSAEIKTHEVTNRQYSPAYAYRYVAELVSNEELLLFFDVSFQFSAKFLSHCRMNTIMNKQVFSPIMFSLYKPELVSSKEKPGTTILSSEENDDLAVTSDNGFFLRYNYQVLCIYRSDYVKLGGYKHSKDTSSGNEVIKKILNSDIYLMRTVEPFLTKPFQSRNCNGAWMTKSMQESCMKSYSDSIGSKTSLGSYLLHNKILQ